MHSQPKNVALGSFFCFDLFDLWNVGGVFWSVPNLLCPHFFVKFKFPNDFYSLCTFFNALVYINLTIPVQYRGIHVMSAKTPSLLKPPCDASIYLPLFLSPALVHSPAVFLHFYQVHSTKWTTSHQVHCTYSSHPPPRSTLPSAVAAKKCTLQ